MFPNRVPREDQVRASMSQTTTPILSSPPWALAALIKLFTAARAKTFKLGSLLTVTTPHLEQSA
jgi:hypothetical protein